MKSFFTPSLVIHFCESLAVLIGQTYDLIIPTNSKLTLFNVSFLAIASFTKVTSVFTFPPIALTFPTMLSLGYPGSTPSQSCLPFLSVQPMVSSSGPRAKTLLKPSTLFLISNILLFFRTPKISAIQNLTNLGCIFICKQS